MKRIMMFVAIAIVLQSCTDGFRRIKIKGKYEHAKVFYFDKTQDEVWNAVMKTVAQRGLSVRSFERASGVIFGEDSYSVSRTYENDKGELVYAGAYIVSEKLYNSITTVIPRDVHAKWNILVYADKGKTALYVNMFDILASGTHPVGNYITYYDAISTGNFEKMIADSITF